jgi:molecular chaperone DnaJ
LDVIATVPINIAQATLGSKISVKTLDGKKVLIKIPPGTASANVFASEGREFRNQTRKGSS